MRIAGIGARASAAAPDAAATDYARFEPDEAVRLGLDREGAALLHPLHPAGARVPLPHLWQTSEIRIRCASAAAPAYIASWPYQTITGVQLLATKSGGDTPSDGLHLLSSVRLDNWISSFNVSARRDEADDLVFTPGRLMQSATGVWELVIDVDP